MEDAANWIGREQVSTARLDGWPLAGLFAALNDDTAADEGAALPPTAHWLYFAPFVPQAELGEDGHPQRGGFLPPIALPRRMWAASDMDYRQPLHIGQRIEKRSRIADVAVKEGRSGKLAFVTVEHDYEADGSLALRETQKLVYRGAPTPGDVPPPPQPAPDPAWSHIIVPDTRLLFRYSAVTFNAHRIHYDEPYARNVEGYPGLVVHGQLTATLLIRAFMAEHPHAAIRSFGFRAVRPLYAGTTVRLEGSADGEGYRLWARDPEGAVAVEARIGV